MEKHPPIGNFSYTYDGNQVKRQMEKSSGWYVSFVKYESDVGRLEKFKTIAISQPIAFQHKLKSHQKIFFYRGVKGEVFWFTQKTKYVITLNILKSLTEMPKLQDFERARCPQLFDFVTKGPSNIDNDKSRGRNFNVCNALPRLIRDSVIVFPMFRPPFKDKKVDNVVHPLLHFFDFEMDKMITVHGATGLLYDYGNEDRISRNSNHCILRCSPHITADEHRLAKPQGIITAHSQFEKDEDLKEVPFYYKQLIYHDLNNKDEEIIDLIRGSQGSRQLNLEMQEKSWKSVKTNFPNWFEVKGEMKALEGQDQISVRKEYADDLYSTIITEYESITPPGDQNPKIMIKRTFENRTFVQILKITNGIEHVWGTDDEQLAFVRDDNGRISTKQILRQETPAGENFVLMQVTGMKKKAESAYARIAKGSEWHLEFPVPLSAFKVDENFLLVSTVQTGGKIRYIRVKLKEKKDKKKKDDDESKSKHKFSGGFQLMSTTNRARVSFA